MLAGAAAPGVDVCGVRSRGFVEVRRPGGCGLQSRQIHPIVQRPLTLVVAEGRGVLLRIGVGSGVNCGTPRRNVWP